jgi:hypothetical protein
MTRLAELFPLPLTRTETAPEPADPLTPARHSLRQAIARCDRARREAEAAATMIGRLSAIIDEHSRLQAELHELCVRDEGLRGEWIAGGRVGPDPGDPSDTHALNNKIAGMADELAAARRVMPAKEDAHRDAILKLQAAQTERSAAVAAVAVEVCEDLARELTQHLNVALQVEARLRSVLLALNAKGNAGDSSAGHAAEKITGMITAAKRGAGVPHDATSGPALLEALCEDPGAKLP